MQRKFMDFLGRVSGDHDINKRFSAEALAQLRSERIKQAVSNTVPMTISNMFFATVVCWWFWGRGADAFLGVWTVLLVGINAVGLFKYVKRDSSKPFSGSKRSYQSLKKQAFILAAMYGIPPYFLIPIASGSDAAIIAGMAASSAVIGPYIFHAIPQAALIWIITAGMLSTSSFFGSMDGPFVVSGIFGIIISLGVAKASLSQSKRLTEQFSAQQKLREKQDVISLLLQEHEESASAWVWECDAEGNMTRVPPQLRELLFGRDVKEHEEMTIFDLVDRDISDAADDRHELIAKIIEEKRSLHDIQFEIWAADAAMDDDTSRWISVRGKPHVNAKNELTGYRGIVSDITDNKVAEDKIRFMAGHDPLTQLANRITFGEGLQPWIDTKQPFATLHLDLDRFKLVNDTMGHLAGDELLIEVANRLTVTAANIDASAIVARIGGDEFVVGLPLSLVEGSELVDVTAAEKLARRIVKELAKPFSLSGGTTSIGASVGFVVYPEDCSNASDMPACADLALYRAKNDGRGQFARYQVGMDQRAHDRRKIEFELRNALKKDQMRVVYQPVVDLKTGVVNGVEALLRWEHSELGTINPERFIPIAEDNGTIVSLGKWVLEQACSEAVKWPKPLSVAVNVSAKQILREDFVPMVLDTLAQTKLPPKRLELELTESILVQDASAALNAIRSLRSIGVSVVLDDFGTGYSSLSYLRDFAFDKIKIDKSFISNLGEEGADEAQGSTTLVTAIVNLAKTLGMRTTAEGIEQESQADDLREMGCNVGQGYLFARPVGPEELRSITGMAESKSVDAKAS